MGMFDSFIDSDGREWQTKAFDRNLDVWREGDPFEADADVAFQVEAIHAPRRTRYEILNNLGCQCLTRS